MKTTIRNLIAVLAVLAAVGGRAQAQSSTTGAVQGVVTDAATGATMPGVTVVATSPALQGTQSAMTEANGAYKITNLPPGSYEVKFYYADITVQRKNLQVSINKVTPVFVKFDTSKAGGETVEITDKAPTIDTTSTVQGVTLDENYMRNIPIPGRTFEGAIGAAAGAQDDALGVSFSGSTSLENNYVVDGVNTTALSYGTVGSPVINEFIKEIEVITGGYQAEYGRATGGVVNVVTKSGTNEFHGSVFTNFDNDLLAVDPDRFVFENPIETKNNTIYDLTFGAELGGPIIKDKLWFFVGFAPRLISIDTQRITKRLTDCRIEMEDGSQSPCRPDEPGYQDGEPDLDANGDRIFEDIPGGSRTLNTQVQEYQFVSKLNYALSPEQQGQLTFSGQPYAADVNGAFGLPSATHYKTSGLSTDVAAKWTSKFNNNKTEVETSLTWHRAKTSVESDIEGAMDAPFQDLSFGNLGVWSDLGYESAATKKFCADRTADDPYEFIENCPDLGAGYAVGGLGGIVNDVEKRYGAKLGGIQRVKAAGDHEIKAGIDVEQNLLNKPRAITGDRFYVNTIGNSIVPVGASIQESRWIRVRPPGDTDPRFNEVCGTDEDGNDIACEFLGPTDVEGNTFNWAAYLRDSWQIMPNLTFNAGLRYEEQRLRYAKFVQNTLDPFTGQERGTNALALKNMWAPRLGLTYDWTKEGRSKAYASYGRFYESIPMDINDRSFGGETFYRQVWNPGQCGSNQMGFGAPNGENCGADPDAGPPGLGRDVLGAGTLVAPGVKPQYMDEIILGVDYEPIEDLRVGVAYKHRWLGRVLEDVSTDGASTYVIANPGEFDSGEETALQNEIDALTASGSDPGRLQQLQFNLDQFRGIRIFDKPRRDYDAVELTAVKRLSNSFFIQGSYTWSRTYGNFPGLFSPDNGQVDPNISSQYDLIELLANRTGPLPADRPHSFKADGYYTFDLKKNGEITAGASLRAYSGIPKNALGAHFRYGRNESFLLPRGEMGRIDPFWTTDLLVSYGRDLGRGMKVQVFSSMFNLLNKQQETNVDDEYTPFEANPVVGGSYEDLVFLKQLNRQGGETAAAALKKPTFGNTTTTTPPLYLEIGARLIF